MSRSPNRFTCILAVLWSALLGYESGWSQVASAPVEVRVPFAPVPIVNDGRPHVAYELHITNVYRSSGPLSLERVEVFPADQSTPIAKYEGSELAGRVVHPGALPPPSDPRVIAGGLRAVVYMWVTLPARERRVASLRHRLVFRTDKGAEELVDGLRVDVRTQPPAILGAPVRGGNWLVANGPGNHRAHHWAGLLALNGRVTIPQRFAMDLMGLDTTGRAVRGDFRTSTNQDWVGYGADVLAVADGVVREIQDGQPDKAPLAPNPPTAPTAQASAGNYVVLDLGRSTFVFYAHFQPHSLTVKVGDRVRAGQVIGRLGNSGSTTAPHLHLHVADTLLLEESEGLPFLFRSFEALGMTSAERAVGADSTEGPANVAPKRRERELPLDGAVVRFGSTR